MLRFARQLGLFILIQACVLAGLAAVYPGRANGYIAATLDKHAMIAAHQPPRLFLVGGSNVAFGIDSPALDDALPYRPINLGLHANVGLDFLLAEALACVERGDVVVVSLESEHFRMDTTGVTLAALLESRPRSAAYLSVRQWKALLDQGLSVLRVYVRRSLKGKDADREREIYGRGAFNGYGDVVGHHGDTPDHRDYGFSKPIEEVDPGPADDAIRKLNRFALACRAAGVEVWYEFPPIPPAEYQAVSALLKYVQDEMTRVGEMPVLVGQAEAVYPLELFFDTKYHLSQKGKQQRTAVLIDRIRAVTDLDP